MIKKISILLTSFAWGLIFFAPTIASHFDQEIRTIESQKNSFIQIQLDEIKPLADLLQALENNPANILYFPSKTIQQDHLQASIHLLINSNLDGISLGSQNIIMRKDYFLRLITLTKYDTIKSLCDSFEHSQNNFNCLGYGTAAETQGINNCDMESNGELDVIMKLMPKKGNVFDVGANIGIWSKSVLQYAEPIALHAFEPFLETFRKLEKNLATQQLFLHNLAISSSIEEKPFISYENAELNSFFDRNVLKNMSHHTSTVFTITLDEFCKNKEIASIDFLKIDTEGAEFEVLKGGKNLLTQNKIKMIQFEYGGTYIDSKASLKDVYNLLQEANYNIYRIAKNTLLYIPYWIDSLENYQYSNYLAVLK